MHKCRDLVKKLIKKDFSSQKSFPRPKTDPYGGIKVWHIDNISFIQVDNLIQEKILIQYDKLWILCLLFNEHCLLNPFLILITHCC